MPTLTLLLVPLLLLFAGIFLLRKMWSGALAGIFFLIAAKVISSDASFSAAPFINAVLIWAELALLLTGAFVFYQLLQAQNQFEAFKLKMTGNASPVAVLLLLCWFMGSFMEGIAGFGIPAMLVAPLLLTLGYKATTATLLPLAANTTAVTFGALGTPLKVGFGLQPPAPEVTYTLLLNLLPALLMPFVLVWLYTKTEKIKLNWRQHLGTILGAGFCFCVLYAAGGMLSMEYASVLAGGAGMLVFTYFFFSRAQKPSVQLWWQTFWPYLLLVVVLVVAGLLLKQYSWQWSQQIRRVSLYQPGLLFLATGIFFFLFTRRATDRQTFSQTVLHAFQRLKLSLITIFLLVLLTQLIRPEMVLAFQQYLPQSNWAVLAVAPASGIFGSFITGSATMSNLLLGNAVGDNIADVTLVSLVLALLNTGSAVGNAVSLQNILMVKSVTDARLTENQVMGWNMIVVVIYFILVLASLWFIYHHVFITPV